MNAHLEGWAHAATAWLGTYLVHSTLLLCAAWLATRWLASVRSREILWRAALFGGFLTAALQVGLAHRPTLGRFDLAQLTQPAPEPEVAQPALSPEALEAALLAAETPVVAAPAREPRRPDLLHVGPVALALGGTFALGSLLLGAWLLDRRRRGQVPLVEGPVADAFAALVGGDRRLARTALVVCERSDTPHATGLLRPRVVVPRRALDELTPREQRAMLAHELAHLERRDPLWLGLARATQLFMPLQPLNALARRRLAACSEFLCDGRAVARTGDRVALAQSLARVAKWILAEDTLPDAACAMASRRSLLGERVERILDEDAARPTRAPLARGAALAVLGGTALAAPTIVSTPMDGLPLGAAATHSALADLTFGADSPQEEAPSFTDVTPDAATLLHELAEELRAQVTELEAEMSDVLRIAATRALDANTTVRLERLEQGLRTVRSQEMRIRALIEGAVTRGVEAPRVPFPGNDSPLEANR